MRTLLPALTLAAVLAAAPAAAPAEARATLESHCWLAVAYLLRVPEHDRYFVRFVTWYAVRRDRPEWRKFQRWWHNQISTEQAVARPVPVPGSAGLLWALDLRDCRWNARGWRVVARRDPYCREPWAGGKVARLLREMVGVAAEALEDTGEVPLVAIVRADFLMRDTSEPARGEGTDSYYDLLYARQRFPDGKEAADFPATSDDLDRFFGVKAVEDFLAGARVDTRVGAIVAGSRDDPVNGSLVARQNRVVQVRRGAWGQAFRTFDAFRTAGRKDYIEHAPDVARGKVEFDAGEFLYELPNGGQAMLLADGKSRRVEFADGRVTRPVSADKRHPDVRTGQCFVCHAGEGGFLAPRDMFTRNDRAGIKLKVYGREEANRVAAFFARWEGRVAGWREPYLALVKETTAGEDGKALTPVQLVKAYLDYRDWYDDPVSPEQAALECGVDVLTLRVALAADVRKVDLAGKAYPVLGLARLKELAKGLSIPRDAWEADVYRSANLLLRLYRESEAKR